MCPRFPPPQVFSLPTKYSVASRSFVGDAPLLGFVVGYGRVAVIDCKPLGLV